MILQRLTIALKASARRLISLPRDEQGTISVLSVVAIFVLTIVLGMVVNAGRNVQEKIRMQNAADAATYSGATVVARGLNALAFSNHVEAEVFALTAYMRTGRAMAPSTSPVALSFIMDILDAWDRIGRIFAKSSFWKFELLGELIQQKVPVEKEAVTGFLQATDIQSAIALPVFESILRGPNVQPGQPQDPLGGVIPRFQRSVVLTTPQAAQAVASEIARLHGSLSTPGVTSGLERLHGKRPLTAILWRTNALPISLGDERNPLARTLPVFDPNPNGPDDRAYTKDYFELARCQRRRWATETLALWNQYLLDVFYRGIPFVRWSPMNEFGYTGGGSTSAKMSTLYAVWNMNSCAQLDWLLDTEYRGTNLPYVYRLAGASFEGQQQCETCRTNFAETFDCDCLEGIRKFVPPDFPQRPPGYRHYVYQNLDALQNPTQPSLLEQYHLFVGVVYWPHMTQTSPVLFRYPLSVDSMAFAQASVFVPRRRYRYVGPGHPELQALQGWLVDYLDLRPPTLHPGAPADNNDRPTAMNDYDDWPQDWDPTQPVHPVNLQWVPQWDVGNQNWMAKLVPATSDSVPAILQSPLAKQFAPNFRVPNLGGLGAADLRRLNTH